MECVGAIVREFVRETLLSMCIEYRYICDNMYVTMHTFMHECVRARLSLYLCLCVCVCVRVYIYRAVVCMVVVVLAVLNPRGALAQVGLCVCVCVRVYIYRAVVYGRTRCPQSTRRSGAG